MKRLYRSKTNHIIGGVCGGLGEYFNLDPVLIRLVWIILILFGGIGLLLYVIAWIIIPQGEDVTQPEGKTEDLRQRGKGRFWWGLVLIIIGILLYGSQFQFIYWPIIPGVHLHSRDFVPLILVLVGIVILYQVGKAGGKESIKGEKWIYRSREHRKIAGVCGGLAEYFNVDPTLVRVLWVAGAFFYGASILLYLILMIALPEGKSTDKA